MNTYYVMVIVAGLHFEVLIDDYNYYGTLTWRYLF